METFYRTHSYLVEHTNAPVRRDLMDEIDWNDRLIGIKGTRGVGKTTFLLQYAKEKFGTDHSCLFINMNNFYFSKYTLVEFAAEFVKRGGKVLLIDQVFKYPEWSHDLRACYEMFPTLKIIFTGSSVMRLKEENPELSGIAKVYYLRGFSFREYLNLQSGNCFRAYTLQEILENHEQIAKTILRNVKPLDYFQDYLHHGFYPFFLEKRNFSENLLKTMNMMIEVDILLIKQIELKYLSKIKKLLYLLAVDGPVAPNVSQLATEIQRALTEFCQSLLINQTCQIFILQHFNFLDFVRSTETIEEVDEWHARFDSSKMGYSSHIHNFLYRTFAQHGETCLAARHDVLMVTKDTQCV
jgi:uncharacterized protein